MLQCDLKHPELLQNTPTPAAGGPLSDPPHFADTPLISEGMTSLQTTLEGLFKRPRGSDDWLAFVLSGSINPSFQRPLPSSTAVASLLRTRF